MYLTLPLLNRRAIPLVGITASQNKELRRKLRKFNFRR